MLVSPQESDPFRIEADSSDFATGAVLSQQSTTDGKWHPVAFYSKSLSSVERNYEIHDKEMLAIIRVLEEWRHFLKRATHLVEIWTDHKNLEYFMTAKKLNRRQARWSLHLARFDFLLHYRPGRTMGKLDAWWDTLSVDFMVKLPESSGHDAVMTVVDSVSKRVHFVPTHTTVTVEGAARLFLHHVWKLYGLPKRVVSDRRPQFVASFTKELYRLLGVRLSSSTAWHPQTDGQTERINQELDQFLRLFVNERQNDWYDLLLIAEFQHNNHVHSATQQPPSLLNTGRIPHMGFEPSQAPSGLEMVNKFTERMKSATEEVYHKWSLTICDGCFDTLKSSKMQS